MITTMNTPTLFRLFIVAFAVALSGFSGVALAQTTNATQPVTDPVEARAINAIFSRWRIAANSQWNISGELCTGTASDNSTVGRPGIKCDCSYNDSTVCHIVSLDVYSMSDVNSSSDVSGPLPDELWSLTYLTNLNLGQNLLTGRLSPSIGNLTRMQYLDFGINALSGELPRELGRLTDLRKLAIGTNNFSGPLPSDLGNCVRLEELWLDSSGISGEIPPTFAGLQNMRILYSQDNGLQGQLPDFIGSWTRLTTLRLEGNSLSGPIPPSFSNLTALIELRISDLSNGSSSSLDFLTTMSSLTTLVLRNNNISGSIPSNFSALQRVSLMDMSFNNFSGQLPDALFNMGSLVHLFLGNNRLTGSLPMQKAQSLQYIDLSYNQLSGSFPSWANDTNVHINLVANNFTIAGSNSSIRAFGLDCLQRNFPCNRGNPLYSSFAVRSGGQQMRSSAGITYETDDTDLGPAAYFVSPEQRWAVSNVGFFTGRRDTEYKLNIGPYVPNARDPELFRNARISAGSLRYYGLGLENGGYNVSLQFVEPEIEDSQTWRSLGRRIFDIYIQGNLVLKDFDIRREAGGSFIAVERDFTARVTENYLEVHLLWAGKGTCCVPKQGTFGPAISAISIVPGDFPPTVTNRAPNQPRRNSNAGMIAGIVVSVGFVCLLSLFAFWYFVQRRKRRESYDEEFLGIEARPYTFSYAELKAATNDFSAANKLGEGGFGPVYKGTLEDGRVVAVKQLSVASHQGKSQFVAEIATISAVQHRNLVKLHGCCLEGDKRLLVYEFHENKSLDQALFGAKKLFLDWATRFDICLGIARGLAYLHEESRLRIVHRDVKASNVLLDSELIPKISDFGLAKLYDDKKTHISTRVAGTIGYLAPEYAMMGHLTEKADVFGFGVLVLEIVSGRPNSDPSLQGNQVYLLEWAWNCLENAREMDLVDTNLFEYNEEEVHRMVGVALLCSQTSPSARPSMSRVVAMLSGDAEIPTGISKPSYLTEWNFRDVTTFVTDSDDPTPQFTGGTTSSSSSGIASQKSTSDHCISRPMLRSFEEEGR